MTSSRLSPTRSPAAAKRAARLLRHGIPFVCVATFSLRAPAEPSDWQSQVNAATDRINRGIDQSVNTPSTGAGVDWYPGSGLFAGASAWTIKLFDGAPLGGEFLVDVGYAWRWKADWSLTAMLAHYQFAHSPAASHLEYDDLDLIGSWRDFVFFSVSASPNTAYGPSPRTWAYSYNLTTHVPLSHGLSAIAGVGYYDLQAGLGGGFLYDNIGLSYQYRDVNFQVGYFGTRASAAIHADLDPSLVHRWVAQVSWHF